jgi:transcription initiation factor TFIIIB Brf1 subunit/transcription initiation factor TFIIB
MRDRKRRARSTAISPSDMTVAENRSTSIYSLTGAAHQLGVHPRTLTRWLRALNITPPRAAGDRRHRVITDRELELVAERFTMRHARADEWREQAEQLKRVRKAKQQVESLTKRVEGLQEALKELTGLLEQANKVG